MIQGSGLRLATCLVTATDLRHVCIENHSVKFADDTYLIVPAANSRSCNAELAHVNDWPERNNLLLNCSKAKGILFRSEGKRGRRASQIRPPREGMERVSSLTALGVVISDDRMTAADHISGLLTSCSRLLYALQPRNTSSVNERRF